MEGNSFAAQPVSQRSDSFGKILLVAAFLGLLLFFSFFGGGSETLFFVVGFCVQVLVLLVGLVAAVFRLSHPSWARAVAILIAVLQIGASMLLLAMARAFFRFI
ncbi:MAG: hypothetical protein Q7R41_05235 [Phycisphaerales bacterium]|nr:hypothetical protein [Phycisphaerales bacterium]